MYSRLLKVCCAAFALMLTTAPAWAGYCTWDIKCYCDGVDCCGCLTKCGGECCCCYCCVNTCTGCFTGKACGCVSNCSGCGPCYYNNCCFFCDPCYTVKVCSSCYRVNKGGVCCYTASGWCCKA